MNTFKKIKLKNSEYDYLFIAIESDTTVVEAVPVIKKINKNAKILFDMFLKQGNNSRRFIEYNYSILFTMFLMIFIIQQNLFLKKIFYYLIMVLLVTNLNLPLKANYELYD